MAAARCLTPQQARAFYDRFGKRLDNQAWYENRALDELVAHAALGGARSVFEFGCGTGRLAEKLLRDQLPQDARYLGVDISTTMVALARERLAPFGERAAVTHIGTLTDFTVEPASVDRLVSTYVFDLLSEDDIREALAFAHRVLAPGGLLCTAGLTLGVTVVSKLVTASWRCVHRLRPQLVGGCRPLRLADHLDGTQWEIAYRTVVVARGIASEVCVARRK